MPCYHPLRGYREPFAGSSGKYRITGIKARSAQAVAPPGACAVDIPCGQCIGCRLEHSRKWASRLMHEASLHDFNSFITLTYSDEYLPRSGSLDKSEFQRFMKRLRKEFGDGIKFFHCGEYGDRLGRPHYHAILFGVHFSDRVAWQKDGANTLYRSPTLERLWRLGHSSIGEVTFESAAYVARYCLKKVTGERAEAHYERVDQSTGELFRLQPEYVTMSRGGRSGRGIAFDWFNSFSSDTYPDDFVLSRGVRMKPPRYYDDLLEKVDPELMASVRAKRAAAGYSARDNSTLDRLKVREQVAHAKLSMSKRSLDDET